MGDTKFSNFRFYDTTLKCDIHWKAVEQYFTVDFVLILLTSLLKSWKIPDSFVDFDAQYLFLVLIYEEKLLTIISKKIILIDPVRTYAKKTYLR